MRAGVAYSCLSLVVMALLGACVTARDPVVTGARTVSSGNWRIENETNRVTGAPLASALLRTGNSSNSKAPFAEPAYMQLACLGGRPVVSFGFGFKVGSSRNSSLSYRFDDRPGREAKARFLHHARKVVIEDENAVAEFTRELANAKALYLLIRSLNAGRSSAEFKVEGAQAAIEAGFAGCPTKFDRPRQRRASTPVESAARLGSA